MPKEPKGEKRPADVSGNAVTVMRIATGEVDETLTDDGKDKAATCAAKFWAGPSSSGFQR